MSHSYRYTPICGISGESDKEGKMKANRRLRRICKKLIHIAGLQMEWEDGIIFPSIRDISDVWNWRKDGKTYFLGDTDIGDWEKRLWRK